MLVHFYESIEGWFHCREYYDRLIRALPADRLSLFVELGVWRGRSTAYAGVEIANSGKPITLVSIDHFLDCLEDTTRWKLAPLEQMGPRFRLIAGDSARSAEAFADGSADVVWVDADHSYLGVMADLRAWWPKVRGGGVIGGDDYNEAGVKQAVTECFGAPDETDGVNWWVTKTPDRLRG